MRLQPASAPRRQSAGTSPACSDPGHHFRGVTKMVPIGSGAGRPIEDFMLIRHACYLIAGSHFSAQSRKQERIDCGLTTVRSL